MMNHDLVLSEREKKNLAQLPVDFFFSPKIFYAGEITKNESNVSPHSFTSIQVNRLVCGLLMNYM